MKSILRWVRTGQVKENDHAEKGKMEEKQTEYHDEDGDLLELNLSHIFMLM